MSGPDAQDECQPPEATPPVSAEPPESPFRTIGTDHVTLVGSNAGDTVRFYRDILGMPLVLRQPNLDRPEVTHLFFDTGDGRVITFFVNEDRESTDKQEPGIGAVHHLAFRIAPERLNEVKAGLEEHGYNCSEFDRGAFHSLYTRDHNGLTIELVVDKYAIPDERRGAVLATAQEKREAAGAEFVKDEHLEAALEELGLPVERASVPETTAGTGVDE